MIVRFTRRDLRNEIYDRRFFVNDPNVYITEHLTERNLKLFKKACRVFGRRGEVWTEQTKIFTKIHGKMHAITSNDDLVKLTSPSRKPSRKPPGKIASSSSPPSSSIPRHFTHSSNPQSSIYVSKRISSQHPIAKKHEDIVAQQSITKQVPANSGSAPLISRENVLNPAHINFSSGSSRAALNTCPSFNVNWSAQTPPTVSAMSSREEAVSVNSLSSQELSDLHSLEILFPNATHGFS